ncbi:MAG: tetratricopeptide repeat protein [Microcoleaceae cyanobacterium]
MIQSYQQAIELLQAGEVDKVIAYCEKILGQMPDEEMSQATIWQILGIAFQLKENFSQAVNCYQRSLELSPEQGQIYMQLSQIFQRQKDWKAAIEIYDTGVKTVPKLDWHKKFFALGNLLFQNEKYEFSVICYRKATQVRPDQFEVYHNLGEALVRLERFDEAINAYQTAIEYNSGYPNSYFRLGKLLVQQKKLDLAISTYEDFLKLQPNSDQAYHQIGNIFSQQQQWSAAISAYRESIKLKSDFLWSHHHLANALLKNQNWEEAHAELLRAIEINPDFYGSYLLMGINFAEMRELKLAFMAFGQAFEKEHETASLTYRLGETLHRLAHPNFENFAQMCCQAVSEKLEEDLLRQYYFLKAPVSNSYLELGKYLSQDNYVLGAIILYRIFLSFNTEDAEVKSLLKSEQDKKMQAETTANSFEELYSSGTKLFDQKRFYEAADVYLTAMGLQPQSPIWYYAGKVWRAFKHCNALESVSDLYRQLVQQCPDVLVYSVNLGRALTEQENIEGAIDCYEAAAHRVALARHPNLVAKQGTAIKFVPVEELDFVILGTQKGGTTSLHQYLSYHPQVILPIVKEIGFWGRYYQHGLKWYLSQFPQKLPRRSAWVGETTPDYLDHQGTAHRLRRHFPDVKLIVLLRNPVDRAISHYHHWIRTQRDFRPLKAAIMSDLEQLQNSNSFWNQVHNYVARGVYIQFLREWMSVFPKEQFLILKSEDFYRNPRRGMNQVFQFLEIPPKHNLKEYKPYNSGSYPETEQSIRELLSDYFRPYNKELEDFLEVKFNW